MVQINLALREVNCKIVYYGPGRSGKTTNLEMVHAKAPQDSVGELVSISTEADRTLFFDFLPLNLGEVAGMTTKFALYTVPGQVYYNRTRKLVLQGSDGVVFVADSNPNMMNENIESLRNLAENLAENGLSLQTMPIVMQWNKRDIGDAVPVEQLERVLNQLRVPSCEAVAVTGAGVFPTLKKVAALVIRKLNEQYGQTTGALPVAPAAPTVAPPATVSPLRTPQPLAGTAAPVPSAATVPAPAPGSGGVAVPQNRGSGSVPTVPGRGSGGVPVPASVPPGSGGVPTVGRPGSGGHNPIRRELERRSQGLKSGETIRRKRKKTLPAIKAMRNKRARRKIRPGVMIFCGALILAGAAVAAYLHYGMGVELF
jgi:mutual gliding-motility protein MglA